MNYSFKKGLLKGVKYLVLFGIPMLVNAFVVEYPEIAQLTVGGILAMITNFLKLKVEPLGKIIP